MPLNEFEDGNMYPWVGHGHNLHRGRCFHGCTYCYAIKGRASRFYTGPFYLKESELEVKYGSGKTIFIDYMTDLFANGVPDIDIMRILKHCKEYPDNTYVFQTRNPKKISYFASILPPKCFVGTTIESDRDDIIRKYSHAPHPYLRAESLAELKELGLAQTTFVTVEPILKFGPRLLDVIVYAKPDFVNIGADSKNCNLIEPTWAEVQELIRGLNEHKIEIREKSNLDRLRVNE